MLDFALQVTMLTEELKVASPDLDAIERWRVKEAECARRGAELETVRTEREGVRRCVNSMRFAVTPSLGQGMEETGLELRSATVRTPATSAVELALASSCCHPTELSTIDEEPAIVMRRYCVTTCCTA